MLRLLSSFSVSRFDLERRFKYREERRMNLLLRKRRTIKCVLRKHVCYSAFFRRSGEAYFFVHSCAVLKEVSGEFTISTAMGFTKGSAGLGSDNSCIMVNRTLLIVRAADQLFLMVSRQMMPLELILQ